MDFFLPILKALSDSKIRYLVAGGLATVLHGHMRLTGDIDIILDLEDENCKKALTILNSLGFKPRAPVPIMDFADPKRRASWIKEKGLKVFSLCATSEFPIEVDIFAESPFPFKLLWDNSVSKNIGDISVKVLSIAHLIQLKKMAGRPQDLEDIKALEVIDSERK